MSAHLHITCSITAFQLQGSYFRTDFREWHAFIFSSNHWSNIKINCDLRRFYIYSLFLFIYIHFYSLNFYSLISLPGILVDVHREEDYAVSGSQSQLMLALKAQHWGDARLWFSRSVLVATLLLLILQRMFSSTCQLSLFTSCCLQD